MSEEETGTNEELDGIKIISKISASDIGYEVDDLRALLAANEMNDVSLFNVYGMAKRVRTGKHDTHGDWTGFEGNFEAIVFETGEVVRSGQVFLPSILNSTIESQIALGKEQFYRDNAELNKEDEDENVSENKNYFLGIQFAFEVGLKKNKRSGGVGYVFTVKNLMPESKTDPLALMRKKFGAQKSTKVLEQA